MFITLIWALATPIIRLFTEVSVTQWREDGAAVLIIFCSTWMLAALVRWRAGGRGTLSSMTIKVIAATAILVAASAAIALVVREMYPGPGYDTLSEPHLVLYVSWSLLTFIVVSILLSSVRASAHAVKAR